MEIIVGLVVVSLIVLIIIGLPLLIIGLLLRKFLPQSWKKYSNLAMLSLFISFSIYTFHTLISETRYAIDIPGYRVEFYERADVLFFDVPRYFLVYQEDGRKAEFQIDIDASRCMNLQTKTQGSRIYFQCAGESLEQASYVDKEKLAVFSGWYKEETAISELDFMKADKT
ncbi:hypothetical protein NIES267_06010 [Calothrix parasitica NIES-267]|uniref:Uncharacterized protein n=1 Tax=Calothrix parasitica NIES-267 TaxID=1973488 RepID=A0A1Z4LIS2_9CYAN|nr:hypothetical protein NIES267_06010 [Calothrix parasitica NIES-267]